MATAADEDDEKKKQAIIKAFFDGVQYDSEHPEVREKLEAAGDDVQKVTAISQDLKRSLHIFKFWNEARERGIHPHTEIANHVLGVVEEIAFKDGAWLLTCGLSDGHGIVLNHQGRSAGNVDPPVPEHAKIVCDAVRDMVADIPLGDVPSGPGDLRTGLETSDRRYYVLTPGGVRVVIKPKDDNSFSELGAQMHQLFLATTGQIEDDKAKEASKGTSAGGAAVLQQTEPPAPVPVDFETDDLTLDMLPWPAQRFLEELRTQLEADASLAQRDAQRNDRRSTVSVLRVKGAGGGSSNRGRLAASCNGRYERDGEENGYPLYRQTSGSGIIYWAGRWRMNPFGGHENATKSWIYSIRGESHSPPDGQWTNEGYDKDDVLPAPVVAYEGNEQRSLTPATTLNMIFEGNDGTGKADTVRHVATICHEFGRLANPDHVLVADAEQLLINRHDLSRVLGAAKGGVLFVDHAARLLGEQYVPMGGRVVLRAIFEELGRLTNATPPTVCILGCMPNMRTKLENAHPFVSTLFPHFLSLPDYTPPQLAALTSHLALLRGMELSRDCADGDALARLIGDAAVGASVQRGNAHLAKQLLSRAIQEQRLRRPAPEEAHVLSLADFDAAVGRHVQRAARPTDAILDEVRAIEGLPQVKEFVEGLHAITHVQAARLKLGLPVAERAPALHMVFKGNPGTGKTTIARLLAELLRSEGLLKRGQLVQVKRGDLVSGYVGGTAIKTQEVVDSAIGGVLFLDEAYSLVNSDRGTGWRDKFGEEALTVLLEAMELHRDELVVIFAGYNSDMERLLDTNPGLRSRFPHLLHFEDYQPDELLRILTNTFVAPAGYDLEADAADKCRIAIEELAHRHGGKVPGNGRAMRNLAHEMFRKQAKRLTDVGASALEDPAVLRRIEAQDVPSPSAGAKDDGLDVIRRYTL